MPGIDPDSIRQAVALFKPRRRPRFQNLQEWRDVITELRAKGASCEAIAELLTRHGVKTSRTMVNEFVQTPKQTKAKGKPRRIPATILPGRQTTQQQAAPAPRPEPSPIQTSSPKSTGPHIAKVELLPPGESYD